MQLKADPYNQPRLHSLGPDNTSVCRAAENLCDELRHESPAFAERICMAILKGQESDLCCDALHVCRHLSSEPPALAEKVCAAIMGGHARDLELIL